MASRSKVPVEVARPSRYITITVMTTSVTPASTAEQNATASRYASQPTSGGRSSLIGSIQRPEEDAARLLAPDDAHQLARRAEHEDQYYQQNLHRPEVRPHHFGKQL